MHCPFCRDSRNTLNISLNSALFLTEFIHSVQVLKSEIPDSLLRDKDEYEAYWEHYISVKEELVEKILQVSVLARSTDLKQHELGLLSVSNPVLIQDTVEDENEQLLGGGSSSACHTAEGSELSLIHPYYKF